MNEEELRNQELEDELDRMEIVWKYTECDDSGGVGIVLYNYDIGFSIVNKENTEDCWTNFAGPATKKFKDLYYMSKEEYRKWVSNAVEQVRSGIYDVDKALKFMGRSQSNVCNPKCTF
jgi:hypothetical protein